MQWYTQWHQPFSITVISNMLNSTKLNFHHQAKPEFSPVMKNVYAFNKAPEHLLRLKFTSDFNWNSFISLSLALSHIQEFNFFADLFLYDDGIDDKIRHQCAGSGLEASSFTKTCSCHPLSIAILLCKI